MATIQKLIQPILATCQIYESRKKKKKNQDPSIFLATYWNLLWKYGDLKKIYFQKLANLNHFFPMKNPFVLVEITFFRFEFLRKFANKKEH